MKAELDKIEGWGEYTRISMGVLKRCRPFLSLDEFAVLNFIFERTYGYYKIEEYIPLSHFLYGVFKKNGEPVTSRVGIGKAAILEALMLLKEKGLIQVEQGGGRDPSLYRITDPEDLNIPRIKDVNVRSQAHLLQKGTILPFHIGENNFTTRERPRH